MSSTPKKSVKSSPSMLAIVATAIVAISLPLAYWTVQHIQTGEKQSYAQAAQSFTFAAAGDVGSANSTTKLVMDGVSGSGSSFMVMLGDLSYNTRTPETNWCNWVKYSDYPTNSVLRFPPNFPVQLISGNHEDDGPDGLIENFASCLPNLIGSITGTYAKEYYFDYPQTGPALARFILVSPDLTLDGVRYDYLGTPPNAKTSHYLWLENAIDSARTAGIPWVIVGMHKNCITMGDGIKVTTCESKPDIMNVLLEKRVDLILQGHEHNYQRSKQLTCATVNLFNPACVADDGSDNLYTKGAGSVIDIVGTGGISLFTINPADSEAGYFARWSGELFEPRYGFLKVTVNPDSLNAAFVGTGTGTFTDSFTITGSGGPTPVPTTPTPTSPPVPTPTPTTVSTSAFLEQNGEVVMEAEHFSANVPGTDDSWVERTSPTGFVGTSFMRAEPSNGSQLDTGYALSSPRLDFPVQFSTTGPGTYNVWVRGHADTFSDDSFHVGLNGAPVSSSDRMTLTKKNQWQWTKSTMDTASATLVIPSAGLHTINVWMREDGIRVDRLLLRKSSTTPTGNGPTESPKTGGGTITPSPSPTPVPATSTPTSVPVASPTPTPTGGVSIAQTFTTNPTADTRVEGNNPGNNYGTNTWLRANGSPVETSYLKFNLGSLAGQTIVGAKLRFRVIVETYGASAASQGIKLVANTGWTETGLTYTSSGSFPLTTLLGAITPPSASGTWIEVPLNAAAIQPYAGQLFSLGVDSTGTDSLYFYSRETTSKPELIITY